MPAPATGSLFGSTIPGESIFSELFHAYTINDSICLLQFVFILKFVTLQLLHRRLEAYLELQRPLLPPVVYLDLLPVSVFLVL